MKKYSDAEIEAAARKFEELADSFDLNAVNVDDTEDLRAIAQVSDALRADELDLFEAVVNARQRGRSWTEIAMSLGVTRQAARQRFVYRTSLVLN